jgi:hypothetical protein
VAKISSYYGKSYVLGLGEVAGRFIWMYFTSEAFKIQRHGKSETTSIETLLAMDGLQSSKASVMN